MKKRFIIMVSMCIILAGVLNGCTQIDSRFVGTWNHSMIPITYVTFFSDETCNYYTEFFDWKVKDGNLVLKNENGQLTFEFSFTDNDKTLTLTNIDTGKSDMYYKQ